MTIEYVLLLVVVLAIGLKSFTSAPANAFLKDPGARLGARVEKHLVTGQGFSKNENIAWTAKQ